MTASFWGACYETVAFEGQTWSLLGCEFLGRSVPFSLFWVIQVKQVQFSCQTPICLERRLSTRHSVCSMASRRERIGDIKLSGVLTVRLSEADYSEEAGKKANVDRWLLNLALSMKVFLCLCLLDCTTIYTSLLCSLDIYFSSNWW